MQHLLQISKTDQRKGDLLIMSKQLKIHGLNITSYEEIDDSKLIEYIERSLKDIDLKEDFVNILKIEVGDCPKDQVHKITCHLSQLLKDKDVNNCIFVPIWKFGIQDITMDKYRGYTWVDIFTMKTVALVKIILKLFL